ncbi:MAG: hypothetical protein GY749_47285 [Desulfobacteraceae bacterium]|nr:hypothetical protein [Desulfobacteraceae bacterium]
MRIGVAKPGYQPGSGDKENFKAICRTISRYYGQWGAASPNCDIVVHPNLYTRDMRLVRQYRNLFACPPPNCMGTKGASFLRMNGHVVVPQGRFTLPPWDAPFQSDIIEGTLYVPATKYILLFYCNLNNPEQIIRQLIGYGMGESCSFVIIGHAAISHFFRGNDVYGIGRLPKKSFIRTLKQANVILFSDGANSIGDAQSLKRPYYDVATSRPLQIAMGNGYGNSLDNIVRYMGTRNIALNFGNAQRGINYIGNLHRQFANYYNQDAPLSREHYIRSVLDFVAGIVAGNTTKKGGLMPVNEDGKGDGKEDGKEDGDNNWKSGGWKGNKYIM